jgi:hypothetical protein
LPDATAHVNAAPAETAVTFEMLLTGERGIVLVEPPSCPESFAPQQNKPVAVFAQV